MYLLSMAEDCTSLTLACSFSRLKKTCKGLFFHYSFQELCKMTGVFCGLILYLKEFSGLLLVCCFCQVSSWYFLLYFENTNPLLFFNSYIDLLWKNNPNYNLFLSGVYMAYCCGDARTNEKFRVKTEAMTLKNIK